jgi:hypothetical protein
MKHVASCDQLGHCFGESKRERIASSQWMRWSTLKFDVESSLMLSPRHGCISTNEVLQKHAESLSVWPFVNTIEADDPVEAHASSITI